MLNTKSGSLFVLPDFEFWRFLVKFTVFPLLLFFFFFFPSLFLCPSSLLSPYLVSWPGSEAVIQPHLEGKTFFDLTFKPQAY